MKLLDGLPTVNSKNVGRLAERIVANELEWRGFKVSALNKEGLAPNADLLAAKGGKTWQIQVKGATNRPGGPWWVEYGFCTTEIIKRRRAARMFNRRESFYKADIVVLVAVRSRGNIAVLSLGLMMPSVRHNSILIAATERSPARAKRRNLTKCGSS